MNERTQEYSMALLMEADELAAKGKRCKKVNVTCKPKMGACTGVVACKSFDHPGCSPLECKPVKSKVML